MAELGELTAITSLASTEEEVPRLEGVVKKVDFKGTLKTLWNKSPVTRPHWEIGVDVIDSDYSTTWHVRPGASSARYSKRPAVLKVPGAGGDMTVEVVVEITKSENVSGTARLSGMFGFLEIEGECPVSAGEHTVTAKITNMEDKICWVRGKILWSLHAESAERSFVLNMTFAELFAILDQPLTPAFSKGVWAEALRLVCEDAKIVRIDLKEKKKVAARVTKYCFLDHNLFYDCWFGGDSYGCGLSGGTFELEKYLKQTDLQANCYDQAAAVQVLAGCVGVHMEWIGMGPYGYITPTKLLGWHGHSSPKNPGGLCNSPFFDADVDMMLVGRFEPWRTSFGNHAFCWYEDGTFDACSGPHLGTENGLQYCKNAIDSHRKRYTTSERPGEFFKDFKPRSGVTAVI